jgi:hypothetical protein
MTSLVIPIGWASLSSVLGKRYGPWITSPNSSDQSSSPHACRLALVLQHIMGFRNTMPLSHLSQLRRLTADPNSPLHGQETRKYLQLPPQPSEPTESDICTAIRTLVLSILARSGQWADSNIVIQLTVECSVAYLAAATKKLPVSRRNFDVRDEI